MCYNCQMMTDLFIILLSSSLNLFHILQDQWGQYGEYQQYDEAAMVDQGQIVPSNMELGELKAAVVDYGT